MVTKAVPKETEYGRSFEDDPMSRTSQLVEDV